MGGNLIFANTQYMKKNHNKYFDFYQDRLQDNLDIEIMFINVKR